LSYTEVLLNFLPCGSVPLAVAVRVLPSADTTTRPVIVTVPPFLDSLGIPQQIRKQRLGHSGNGVTEGYTHTFTQDERAAAEKLGELFGTGWPEKKTGKLIPFPNLSQMQQEPAEVNQQAFANQ
jgi:hypothetical protein